MKTIIWVTVVTAAFFWGMVIPGPQAEQPLVAPMGMTILAAILLASRIGYSAGHFDGRNQKEKISD